MTTNQNRKRQVRARAAKTGESYTAALRQVRAARPLRLAIGSTELREDPRDEALLRAGGAEVRALMARAHRAGARLLHLPEGAICFPHKRILSSDPGPGPQLRTGPGCAGTCCTRNSRRSGPRPPGCGCGPSSTPRTR